MIVPAQSDAKLLADICGYTPAQANAFALWWLGQSGFLLKYQDSVAVIDPYLSDSLTVKYAESKQPHVRMTARCVDPAALAFVQVAFITHGHTDHFDAVTLRAMATAPNRTTRLQIVMPASLEDRAHSDLAGVGIQIIPVNVGEEGIIGPYRYRAVPAAHTTLETDRHGQLLFLGYVLTLAGVSVYHSGDTVWSDEVLTAVRPLHPDVALLPINGHDPSRGVAGNLNPIEAAEWAKTLGVKLVIPHHYEMFEFNTASAEPFVMRCRQIAQSFHLLRCGERWPRGNVAVAP